MTQPLSQTFSSKSNSLVVELEDSAQSLWKYAHRHDPSRMKTSLRVILMLSLHYQLCSLSCLYSKSIVCWIIRTFFYCLPIEAACPIFNLNAPATSNAHCDLYDSRTPCYNRTDSWLKMSVLNIVVNQLFCVSAVCYNSHCLKTADKRLELSLDGTTCLKSHYKADWNIKFILFVPRRRLINISWDQIYFLRSLI
jgi:hypothetical protein